VASALSASARDWRSSARRIARSRSRYGSGSARRAASSGRRQAPVGRPAAHGRPIVEEGGQLDHRRLALTPQQPGELRELARVEVQARGVAGGGIGGVGPVGADGLLIGADLHELLAEPGVALGPVQPGAERAAQGCDPVLRPLALGAFQRRQRVAPPRRLARLAERLVAQRHRLGEDLGEPGVAALPLLEYGGEGEPAGGGEHQQRGRQPDLEPPGPPLGQARLTASSARADSAARATSAARSRSCTPAR
jgi:hypothetical protein